MQDRRVQFVAGAWLAVQLGWPEVLPNPRGESDALARLTWTRYAST